jgi:hypothetical protein
MKAYSLLGSLLAALGSTVAVAQLNLPTYVQLPRDDFVWPWGEPLRPDGRLNPDFDIQGQEQGFRCLLTGGWRPGSHMKDWENDRDFRQALLETLYFIQDATIAMNDYYRSLDLDWAVLDCKIPESEPSEEKTQEKLDKAVERAERARDRRRERDED